MKKKVLLIIAMLMSVAILFTACNKDTTKPSDVKENTAQEEKTDENNDEDKKNTEDAQKSDLVYIDLVKEAMGTSDGLDGELAVKFVKLFKTDEKDDALDILASYTELRYNYADHVFENTAGMIIPVKLSYTKKSDGTYELKEKLEAEDGAASFDSILKMTDGDEALAKDLATYTFMKDDYTNLMKELNKAADAAGLKDYTLNLDSVPGYAKDESLFIEDVPNEPKNTIAIVNKEEYEKAKKNEDNDNWPHVQGLLYDKETKIAVKSIIDDFTK